MQRRRSPGKRKPGAPAEGAHYTQLAIKNKLLREMSACISAPAHEYSLALLERRHALSREQGPLFWEATAQRVKTPRFSALVRPLPGGAYLHSGRHGLDLSARR